MLLAIDIGNSRAKLGRFDAVAADCQAAAQAATLPIAGPVLPEPAETFALALPAEPEAAEARQAAAWIADHAAGTRVVVASVNRPGRAMIESLLADASLPPAKMLLAGDLPIEARVDNPGGVGIDRLLAAVAANRLRRPGKPVVLVDVGTAITVDLVTADGAFEGGAILPGVAMASRALHQQTDLLPELGIATLDAAPDAVGKNTRDAIQAGIFWGAVGAVRELIDRQSDRLTEPPQVLLTGGMAPSVARLLGGPEITVRYVEHLVLSGIAIAAGGPSQAEPS
ncbi:MAG: type III pantothenate kinase [Planctomycetota bacterium]